MASRGDGALYGYEFDTPPLTNFLGFAQENTSNLAGLPDMCPPASGQVKVTDIDEAQFIPLDGRELAQPKLACFVTSHAAHIDGTIFEDDLVRETLGGLDLIFGQRGSVEVDRAIVVRHVEGDGRHFEESHESSREHVLAG